MNECRTWYGKEFTRMGGALLLMLALISMPMHEFGHWIAYWIFGIPAELGIMFDPIVAFIVRPLTEPDIAIRLFVSFFGGGVVFIVAGIIAIKSRPSLMIAVFGLAGGITELVFRVVAETQGLDFPMLIQSHFELYVALQVVPFIVVYLFGLSEFRWWLRSMCTR